MSDAIIRTLQDIVGHRYGISRQRQDEYSVESQRRTAAAQQAGLFDDEIVPMETKMEVKDKTTGETSLVDYTVVKDEVRTLTICITTCALWFKLPISL